ncbi:MAG: hypothetical protein JWO22_1034 [Frankiales bacterium]|nr:hypothetical protein [Frankiales bacterium]
MRKRSAGTLLVVALGLPVLPLTAARAAGEPGSGFGSVRLHAVAHGEEFLFSSTTQVPAQMSVPYAASDFLLGEGVGLATVAWPGDTGASLGTTLQVGFGAPSQASVLNDPAIASARSGTGDADVRNTTVPGATVHATATKQKATASASVDGAAALTTTAGSTASQSAVQLTGAASAVGTASTSVRDVTIGGVVHIGAVTSTATGSTDGQHADAKGSTSVTGVSIAGVAVTVDADGVSVAGTTLLPPGAADAVTGALAQAQITLTLTKPVKALEAGKVEYSTGGLVVTTPLGTLTLGGAELVLSATRGDDSAPPPGEPTSGPTTPSLPGTTTGVPGITPAGPVVPIGAGQPSVVPPSLPRTGAPPALAAVPLSLRTGYGWAWGVSGLLLAFLAASGLMALSRRWLIPDLSGCPLERRPT